MKPLLIDGHADTLCAVWDGSPRLGERVDGTDFDLVRAREVGLTAQFFAVAPVHHGVYREPLSRWLLSVWEGFFEALDARPDALLHARCADDVLAAHRDGKLAVFLTIEGGDVLDGDLSLLRMFHRIGVRLLGLTHFRRNAIADSTRQNSARGRLTPFGEAVVKELERLGMLCDLAHISDTGFEHVLDIAEKPVVFSHGNARALTPHERNLTDAQLRRLAANGGLIGISFVPFFVDAQNATFGRFLDHLEHLIQVAGVAHVGFGSDFDGFDDPRISELADVTCYPRIADGLLLRGYSDADVAKVYGENWLRVIRAVMG
jgi:membrane dipeptidase